MKISIKTNLIEIYAKHYGNSAVLRISISGSVIGQKVVKPSIVMSKLKKCDNMTYMSESHS